MQRNFIQKCRTICIYSILFFFFRMKEQQILCVLSAEQALTEAFWFGSERLQAGSDKALWRVNNDDIVPQVPLHHSELRHLQHQSPLLNLHLQSIQHVARSFQLDPYFASSNIMLNLTWHDAERGVLSSGHYMTHSYSVGSKVKAWGNSNSHIHHCRWDLWLQCDFVTPFMWTQCDVNASDLVCAVYGAQSCHNSEKATGLRGDKAIRHD